MSQTREFVSEGRTTVVTVSGAEGGPEYVLVHGIGMGHRYWSTLADTLAETGRVYALDLPGFGDAPEPEMPLDMAASGDLLAELVEHFGLTRAVLIGHSMGAEIVAEAAARHPGISSCIVLIAPTVNPRERTAAMQALRLVQDVSLSQPKVMRLGLMYYAKAGPRWYVKKLRTMLAHRMEDVLPRISARTLIIRGARDTVVPGYWARQVERLVPDSRLIELPGRGHETMITGGERVARLIAEHAGALEPAAAGADPPPARRGVLASAWWWAIDYVFAARWQVVALFLRRQPARYTHGDPSKPTVVILPGVYETWVFLRPIADRLSAAGYRVSIVHGMKYNRRTITRTAELLDRALSRAAKPPAGRIIVAHSKGGLIGKQLMLWDRADVRGLVAICTPFAGSHLARYALDPSIRAFLPTDETIRALASDTSVDARITSIYGHFDPHVPEGSVLTGARNIEVDAAGHFRVLTAAPTLDIVVDEVDRIAAKAQAAEPRRPESSAERRLV